MRKENGNYMIEEIPIKEIIFIILFYSFVSLSSIMNLGLLTPVVSLLLISTCSYLNPRTGLVVLLSFFYLPTYQLGIPAPFIVATLIVALFNFKTITRKLGYTINKQLIVLYCVFLFLRFVSVGFVNNTETFWSYFFTSLSVLIHLLIISNLIKQKEDVLYVLRMWGVIGAFAAILGYIHFTMQGTSYLRQIYVTAGDVDKGTLGIGGDFVRWTWAGNEPNFFGLILLIPFAINVSWFLKEKSIFNGLLSLITFAGILGTYSRSSFLVAIFMIILYFAISRSLKNLLLFFFLLLVGGFLLMGYFSEFVERIDSISEALNDNNASGRIPLYEEAVRNFVSNPLFGVGTGQTRYFSQYGLESHNLFLQTLGENGIFSFIVLVSIFIIYFKRTFLLHKIYPLYIITGIAIALNSNTVSYFDMRVFFTLFVLANYMLYFSRQCNKNQFDITSKLSKIK